MFNFIIHLKVQNCKKLNPNFKLETKLVLKRANKLIALLNIYKFSKLLIF